MLPFLFFFNIIFIISLDVFFISGFQQFDSGVHVCVYVLYFSRFGIQSLLLMVSH